jgi:phosphoribosylamine-glycine ligase
MATSQDHKRLLTSDEANTGGMGALSPRLWYARIHGRAMRENYLATIGVWKRWHSVHGIFCMPV